jgi:hypothetical protein
MGMLDKRSFPDVLFAVASSVEATVVVDVVRVVDVVVVVDSAFCFTFGTKCEGARSDVENSRVRFAGFSGFDSESGDGVSESASDSLLLFLLNLDVNRFPVLLLFPVVRSSSGRSPLCSVTWCQGYITIFLLN